MTEIEKERCKSDKMYECLISDSSTLTTTCHQIYQHLNKRVPSTVMSQRLKRMTTEVLTSNDRVAKHAFLFFSLNEEPEIQELFLNEKEQLVPPEKFTKFIKDELPILCDKLLTGSFTSLRGYVSIFFFLFKFFFFSLSAPNFFFFSRSKIVGGYI